MLSLHKIYSLLPVSFQNSACSIVGYNVLRERYNKAFNNIYKEVLNRDLLTKDELIDFRNKELLKFLSQIKTNPFYRKYVDHSFEESIRNNDPIAALKSFPILTKSEVQANSSVIGGNYKNLKYRRVHTSGTTGAGLIFNVTSESIHKQWAVWWRYRSRFGIKREEWCGHFGGKSVVPVQQKSPPFYRINYPGKQLYFSAYHINDKNLNSYVDTLNYHQPRWLHGYPSALALLASLMHAKNMGLNYQVKWITTGAENLLEQHVKIIQTVFGVKPIQHYGMAEGVANISEHPNGKLYVDEDFSYVDFIPSKVTGMYKVIGTNFNNLAFPLVNYEVGDYVSGNNLSSLVDVRVVNSIDGRLEDYIVLSDGTKLGRMDHIFKDMINIKEAQLHQKNVGEVTLRIVRGPLYTSTDEDLLLKEALQRLGDNTKILIDYVDEIAKTKSGKLRFVISEIGK